MRLHFETPHGDRYFVNESGQIGRIQGQRITVQPGPGWTFVGIAQTGPGFAFGKLVCYFAALTPELVKATQWRYSTTGTPRFTVIDNDHGTRRVWGNTKAHGIRYMWYED